MSFLGGVVGFFLGILLVLLTAFLLGIPVPPVLSPFVTIFAALLAFLVPLLSTLGRIAWIVVGIIVVVIIDVFAYALATIALIPFISPPPASGRLPASPLEGFMRGLIIGLTAALNFGIWALLAPGLPVGLILGILCFLAVFAVISISPAYQAVLGWGSWLMPMSLPATALGVILFVVSLIFAVLGFPLTSIRLDGLTGTIEIGGGIVVAIGAPLIAGGGFNLGNFTFMAAPITPFGGPGGLSRHETGHTLNVAAFGNVFHWINAVDENVALSGRPKGPRAYGEFAAESHFPLTPNPLPFITLWS